MAATRPPYAPVSPRSQLSGVERLRLRVRRRARRSWPSGDLLDERAELLKSLDRLEQMRARFATQIRERVADHPAAHAGVEQAIRKADGKFDRGAEVVRHRLLLNDSLLSKQGVRPWEDEER